MRFSIVSSVFNADAYVAEMIESVLAQTFQDYELILIDDGSNDRSLEICKSYANDFHSKIKIIINKNRGPLLSRREGYKAACGEIIMTLDSDDKLRSDALELIDDEFCRLDADIVLFGMSRSADYSTLWPRKLYSSNELNGAIDKSLLVQHLCIGGILNSLCIKAFRRELLDLDCDYSRYGGLKYAEDLLQSLPIVDNAHTFSYIKEPLYYYRINKVSSTRHFDKTQLRQRLTVLSVLEDYSKKWSEELGMQDLNTRIHAAAVQAFVETSQNAIEELAPKEALLYLQDALDAFELKAAFRDKNALNMLRRDFRYLLKCIQQNRFGMAYAFIKAKQAAKQILHR